MNQSSKLAFCAISTALGVALMLLTSLIPIAGYTLPALAGIVTIAVVIEINIKYAFMVFFAIAFLSVFIVPDKEAVLLFIVNFGCYPVIKSVIERNKNKLIQIVFKLLFFNLSAIVFFFISINVLGVPKDSFNIFGVYLPWILLLAENIIFFVYDYGLTGIVSIYINRLHPKLQKIIKF